MYTIAEISNPQYAEADGEAIALSVRFEDETEWSPFVARPTDTFGHGAELFDRAMAGEFGDIAAFEAPHVISGQVDAERDRRTSDGFIFNGTAFQCDLNSQAKITAKGSQAKFAVLAGATAGDLRWSDPNADFGWIATDNSIVPMDAQTMSDFADAADRWVTGHIMAAHAIKQMEPIPADFADDSRWP